MNYLGRLCRELLNDPKLTQRQLAERLGISLGKCNSVVHEAAALGYIAPGRVCMGLTEQGLSYLEQFRVKRAVVLAAGIDLRFVPFTHSVPKSLMEANGERLLERVIRQLQAQGIQDIIVVVGYLAEKFEYLTDRFDVRLIYNPDYATKTNIASLYLVREQLANAYIVSGDQFFDEQLFSKYETESWVACERCEGAIETWCLDVDAKRRIRGVHIGGSGGLARTGPAFFTAETAAYFAPLLENAYGKPGAAIERWESALWPVMDEIALFANVLPHGAAKKFESFEDLRGFDITCRAASGDRELSFIAGVFGVREEGIQGLRWVETNAVNNVFRFNIGARQYICRTPGEETGRFISLRQEAAVYRVLEGTGLTDRAVHADPETGLKVSDYWPCVPIWPDAPFETLEWVLDMYRRLHTCGIKVRRSFRVEERVKWIHSLCDKVDCIHFEDHEAVLRRVKLAFRTIAESEAPLVLCQMNGVSNDLLQDETGGHHFAHWEFSGMAHALGDVATLGLRCCLEEDQMELLLARYLGREPDMAERALFYSYTAACGLLWSLWGEYRQWHGEDHVEYTVRMYRSAKASLKRLERMQG